MIDLYSSATPNGRKISIMLEELGVQYNAIHIDLEKKEQFIFFLKFLQVIKFPLLWIMIKETLSLSLVLFFFILLKNDKFLRINIGNTINFLIKITIGK